MKFKLTKKMQKHTLWISLLLHSLLFGTYFFVLPVSITEYTKHEPLPSYVPAYVDNSSPEEASPESQIDSISDESMKEKRKLANKENETDKHGIETPTSTKQQQMVEKKSKPAAPKKVEFSRNLVPEELSDPNNPEQMHLIGETKIIKPIIKILAKALSEHLVYPKIAQDFNLRGTVLVGFMLHPQGYISETKIVRSSGAGVLDDAARDAVNRMSPVQGVNNYMSKAEFLVVGIIFG